MKDVKRALCLVIAMVLVSAMIIGCGDNSAVTEQPARETGSAQIAEAAAATEAPKAAPTEAPMTAPAGASKAAPTEYPMTAPAEAPRAAPAEAPKAAPAEAPGAAPTGAPMAAPTEAPMAAPTEAPMAVPKAGGMELPMECAPGGMLNDVATVSTCNTQAMQQVRSLSFEGEFDLMAVFPVEGAGTPPGQGVMRLSGAAVLPEDKFRFQISMSPEGQEIEVSGIIAGGDAYMQDPESELWAKGAPPDSLQVVQLVGLIHQPGDAMGALTGSVDLADGTKGYVITYGPMKPEGGMEGFGFPGSALVKVVGADDFLTREIRVGVLGPDGETRDIITISYRGYNEPYEIEPPAEYITLPDDSSMSGGPMGPGTPGAPTIVGFARNEAGDVEVTFSEPVHVQGGVELYVLDSQTGGWGLPLIGGSGTDTLTFDADAGDRPALVLGASRIGGITFPTPDSVIMDSDGAWPVLDFDPWTYE